MIVLGITRGNRDNSLENYEYTFNLSGSDQTTYDLAVRIRIPETVRCMAIEMSRAVLSGFGQYRGNQQTLQLETPDVAGSTKELGSYILEQMIPKKIRDPLSGINDQSLVLTTNDHQIPWELAYGGKNFLCLKCAVGRRVQTAEPYETPETSEKNTANRLKMLIIANPTQDLPEIEAGTIAEGISKDLVEIDCISGREANAANILEKLKSQAYDILHYAGHANFDRVNPGESSLILSGEGMTAGYIRNVLKKPLKLVFVNACSSAEAAGPEYLEGDGKLSGMATAFLMTGIDAYIGTLWPVYDQAASQLAIDFYNSILRGESIGLALRDAKRNNFNNYGTKANTWASFVLYGSPDVRLMEPDGSIPLKHKKGAEELNPEDILKAMFRFARADGKQITPHEHQRLMTEARNLGLSQKQAHAIFDTPPDGNAADNSISAEDVLKAMIRRSRSNGPITPQEHQRLMTTARNLGLSQKKAQDIYKSTA